MRHASFPRCDRNPTHTKKAAREGGLFRFNLKDQNFASIPAYMNRPTFSKMPCAPVVPVMS